MFEELTVKLESVFKKLRGRGKLSEKDVQEALRQVRRVLLEADVNYKVAKEFIAHVQERAIGQEVLKSLTPGQQVIKIVHEELTRLMGGSATDIRLSPTPPTVIMVVGLQGSGKTTVVGKIARHFQSKGKRPLMVAADRYRPAATRQLEMLGQELGVPVFTGDGDPDAVRVCLEAVSKARHLGCSVVLLDMAGGLHIDEEMMTELERVKETVKPHEILFVADGMTGQDAVNSAREFNERLEFDGVVLTKLDGDTRGGAALSIRAVTGKPIKFVGVGERLDAFEWFHPERMASRILGMGDILSLIEKAQEAVDIEEAQKLEHKLLKEEFTLKDFLNQLQQIKKMGSLDQILSLIPGFGGKALKGINVDDRALVRIEAIINSMTEEERQKPYIIDGSRRRRIARGSGASVQEVNRLLKQFRIIQKMAKSTGKVKVKGLEKSLMEGMFGFK